MKKGKTSEEVSFPSAHIFPNFREDKWSLRPSWCGRLGIMVINLVLT
jgi:hypothetical protein